MCLKHGLHDLMFKGTFWRTAPKVLCWKQRGRHELRWKILPWGHSLGFIESPSGGFLSFTPLTWNWACQRKGTQRLKNKPFFQEIRIFGFFLVLELQIASKWHFIHNFPPSFHFRCYFRMIGGLHVPLGGHVLQKRGWGWGQWCPDMIWEILANIFCPQNLPYCLTKPPRKFYWLASTLRGSKRQICGLKTCFGRGSCMVTFKNGVMEVILGEECNVLVAYLMQFCLLIPTNPLSWT